MKLNERKKFNTDCVTHNKEKIAHIAPYLKKGIDVLELYAGLQDSKLSEFYSVFANVHIALDKYHRNKDCSKDYYVGVLGPWTKTFQKFDLIDIDPYTWDSRWYLANGVVELLNEGGLLVLTFPKRVYREDPLHLKTRNLFRTWDKTLPEMVKE